MNKYEPNRSSPYFTNDKTLFIHRGRQLFPHSRHLEGTTGDVANSKRPLFIIPKVQLCLRVTRRNATAFASYPQKLAKIVCG